MRVSTTGFVAGNHSTITKMAHKLLFVSAVVAVVCSLQNVEGAPFSISSAGTCSPASTSMSTWINGDEEYGSFHGKLPYGFLILGIVALPPSDFVDSQLLVWGRHRI